VKEAVQEIVSEAEDETGSPHKLTVKTGSPSDMQEEYNQYDNYTDNPLGD
jgi:hypothetical protein